jgi:hypothetical protein
VRQGLAKDDYQTAKSHILSLRAACELTEAHIKGPGWLKVPTRVEVKAAAKRTIEAAMQEFKAAESELQSYKQRNNV